MKLETSNRKLDAGVQGADKGSVANGQRPTANCTGARRRAGFTLVEMLVVVVIILILLGVVFKMVRPAGLQASKAQTVARLSKLKAAMEEFYAEYGQYPPVPYYDLGKKDKNGNPLLEQPVYYEYAWKGGMRPDLTGAFEDQTEGTAPLFRFGLVSFLVTRDSGHADKGWPSLKNLDQWGNYNSGKNDQARDTRACKQWAPFLEGVLGRPQDYDGVHRLGGSAYTNLVYSASDGWERQFIYVSPPPHQSYLLFSKGPDGAYDSTEPENRGAKANKDNIYGDAGH
jgi:prepilin-type N-terminal cleavage/methylation domain-containing protein